MTAKHQEFSQVRAGPIGWLLKVNGQISEWAASTSWWRLLLLFFVLLLAGSLIGDLLRLKHDRVRAPGPQKESVVTIGGPN